MSKIKNINAFPSQELHPVNYRLIGQNHGMTLRDYFAAKAMQIYLDYAIKENGASDEHLSKAAYKTADAMLKARSNADS